jgi:hypothetical protein
MRTAAIVLSLFFLVLVLWDIFETIVLPRRVTRKFRLARIFYLSTWRPWKAVGKRIPDEERREDFLSIYGPLTMLSLLALWAFLLIFTFALLHWGLDTTVATPGNPRNFSNYLYVSGISLFSLGIGDMPLNRLGNTIMIAEAGTGFGVLALVVSYLPVLFQAFSKREVNISLLDARAGSPPSATEILSRYSEQLDKLEILLERWEDWAAELLESHLTLPILCLYRSQHENQSWIASLTTILDTSSLLMAVVDAGPKWQAQFTFAMARHALADLAHVFNAAPRPPSPSRLSSADFKLLCADLREYGIPIIESDTAETDLKRLRELYEPYSNTLTNLLLVELPPWTTPPNEVDNWRTSAWQKKAPVAIKHSTSPSETETNRMA